MNNVILALVAYFLLAAILYIRYETTSHLSHLKRPPRRVLRFAVPWYYNTSGGFLGTWFLGFWDTTRKKVRVKLPNKRTKIINHPYPERGFRILGFEYWVEYWK